MKCWICEREFNTTQGREPVGSPTNHHIVPKQFRKRKKFKDEKEQICMACHLQINKMFANKELLGMTKKELKAHPKIQSWIKWIRKGLVV